MSALPRFPRPADKYDARNEAEFRRLLLAYLGSERGVAAGAGVSVGGEATYSEAEIDALLAAKQDDIVRGDVALTTASLAHNSTESGTVALGKTGFLLKVVADRACWVRLYGTAAERTADAGRDIADDPTNAAPVLAEFLFDAGHLTIACAPLVGYTSRDTTPTTAIYYSVKNTSGATSTVALTFTRMTVEN